MGKIFFIMGKSATGKDSIYNKLAEYQKLSLRTVIGYTTRPIRQAEIDGREYFFVDEDRLKELQNQGKVIELRTYDTVYGPWRYFTVDDGQIDLDDGNYLYIGTLESFQQVVQYFGNENVVPLYIQVDNGVRLERALKRERKQETPKYAEMCRRFLADEEDFSEENIQRAGIKKRYFNQHFDKCLSVILADIRKEINSI